MSTCSATRKIHHANAMSPQRKRTLGIATCLAAAALVAPTVARLISRSLEPQYEGHGLSFWMAPLANDRIEEAELQQATNAIAHIGVGALPYLVKRLQYKQPQWKVTLARRLSQRRLPFTDKLYDWTTDERPRQLADATCYGFHILGKRAMPAFNELCQIMNNSKDRLVPGRAATALSCLGTNALPPLLEAVANPQHPAQLDAAIALNTIPEVREAVQLEASGAASFLGIANTQPNRLFAINTALMRKGFPQIGIPAVAASMASPDLAARVRAGITPAESGPRDSNVVSALARALADPDINLRRYATNALLEIAPEALTNAPPQ